MCKKILFLFLSVGMFHIQRLKAQTLSGADAGKAVSGSERVILNPATKIPAYVEFPAGKGPAAVDFESWLKRNLKMNPELELSLIGIEKDQIGFEHLRYGQTYNGVTVNHSMLIVHTKNGLVASFNGEFVTNLSPKTDARIPESTALEMAKKSIGAKSYKWESPVEEAFIKKEQKDSKATFFPTGERMLVKTKTGGYALAYRFDIYAQKPLSRHYVYVDANTGNVIGLEERIHEVNANGTATTAYSGVKTIKTDFTGATYRLRETGRGLGIQTLNMKTAGTNYGAAVDFTDADNNWNNVNADQDQYATDAHYGAEMTYDYLKNKYNRNSIDGAGYALMSYVHVDLVAFGHSGNANAFWDGNRMSYGDGFGNITPLTPLDIAGHEITHGLTEKSAKLVYSGESGALNEGFSDIFGTAVEFYGKTGNAGNWTLGEEIGPEPIRSLSNPNLYRQPDTYHGAFWSSSFSDYGGVHTNSGVLNHWFYLLSQGGTGINDMGSAYSVTGITLDKAAAIAFHTLTLYLNPNSNYADARQYAIQAAADLYGACSPEVISTVNAWYAVGIGYGMQTPVVHADGPLSVCSGSSVLLGTTPGADVYQWKKEGVDIPGAISNFYIASGSGNFTLAAYYCGTSYLSAISTVKIAAPVVATVSPSGSAVGCAGTSVLLTATTTPGYSIQWNKNGAPLNGATSATYPATTAGNYSFTSKGTNYPANSFSNTNPVPIEGTDWNCSGSSSSIVVSGLANNFASAGISVNVNITWGNDGDLSIFLESPTGELLGLSNKCGLGGDNYTNTTFSDGAYSYISTGSAPFTGTYKPYPNTFTVCSKTTTKTTFGTLGNGTVNPNGSWKLWVHNPFPSSIGTLDNWKITFEGYSVPAPNCGPVTSAATAVSFLPAFKPGTIASGDQSNCSPFDPNPITLSVNPTGAGAYKYQWYYWNDPTITVPSDVTSGTTSFTDTRFFGTSPDGSGISFDPSSSGAFPGRTWAVVIRGTYSGTTPACGEGQKAFSQRRHFVQNCTFSPGVLAVANKTLCNPADPAVIIFSNAASAGSTFQWHYKDGIAAAPATAAPTTGWTSIAGATANSYDPPAGLTITRTFACRVISGANNQWATGAQQITVLHTVTLGMVTPGDQTLCPNGNPAPITLSAPPAGSGSFSYNWYYKGSTAATCPTGNSLVGWLATAGITNTYDPQSAGPGGRTFALFVTPTGTPTCGTPGWATGCRKTFVGVCRNAVSAGFEEEEVQTLSFQGTSMEQNIPNPWNEHTTFSLFLPENTTDAEIRISGLDGRLHKVIPINGTGNLEMQLNRDDLPNGLYLYTLWTNKQPVAIKKMVLIR